VTDVQEMRRVQEVLLVRLTGTAPFNQSGKQLIGYAYGLCAVLARYKIEVSEATAGVITAILAADPVKWPSLIDLKVGLEQDVWHYNGGGDPQTSASACQWMTIVMALKNRISAQYGFYSPGVAR
jgi:hypothetical protein